MPPSTPPNQPTPHAAPQTDDASVARSFVDRVSAKDWDGASAMLDDGMRAALPKEKLAATWDAVIGSVGAFQRVEGVDVQPKDALRIVNVKAAFERAPLVLRVVLDKARVTGFFVVPVDSWQPPAYAKVGTFTEREVTIGSSPALPATWTTPAEGKPWPAAVLVHGSGPNDRDESVGAVKVFKDLAWGLASRGVAVLRYEKRTRVDPKGKYLTQKDEVDDAAHAAVAFVAAQPDVDPKRVVLIGHSQGGYLAPRIAKADASIKGAVMLAGSTRPLEDSILAQLRYMATLQPNDGKLNDLIVAAERFKKEVENPALKPDDQVNVPFTAPIPGSYFLDVRGYHPEKVAAELAIPLLVLQGDRDYQVTIADDFPPWKAALAKKKNATLKTYPALNHLFCAGQGPSMPAEYAKPAHVDEAVVEDIASWVAQLK